MMETIILWLTGHGMQDDKNIQLEQKYAKSSKTNEYEYTN